MITHKTPGLIDVRAFTLMGVSAKPNSTNPIGQFGTGLKYAISVLVRTGAEVILWIGRDKYTFYSKASDFRGQPVEMLRMKRERWSFTRPSHHDLPFATTYGKNWKPWMAFRELESNTRDEDGVTDYHPEGTEIVGEEGFTTFVIDHPEYDQAWVEMDNVFHPAAERTAVADCQIIMEPGQSAYYRGVRALDLGKPALHTYNILGNTPLTEDRTMYEYWVRDYVARAVISSQDERFIESVVTADEEHWEHNMEFQDWWTPSAAFKAVMRRHPKNLSGSAYSYWSKTDDAPKRTPQDAWEAHPLPWHRSGTTIFDVNNKAVFQAPHGYQGDWATLAAALLERLGVKVNEDGDPIDMPDAPDPRQMTFAWEDDDLPGMTCSPADALLGAMGVKGEQFPAYLGDEVPF